MSGRLTRQVGGNMADVKDAEDGEGRGAVGGGSSPCTQPSAATLGARVVVAEVDESH